MKLWLQAIDYKGFTVSQSHKTGRGAAKGWGWGVKGMGFARDSDSWAVVRKSASGESGSTGSWIVDVPDGLDWNAPDREIPDTARMCLDS